MIAKKRRGISTFIATLLLMVLAVSAGVVIYAYTMGYLGGFGGPQTMGAISLDTWSVPSADGSITIFVRNIGKTTFELQSAYFDGAAYSGTMPTLSLKEGEVNSVTFTGITFGTTTHTVKLIGKDNTQISFNVKR